jgi:hypothetical protein
MPQAMSDGGGTGRDFVFVSALVLTGVVACGGGDAKKPPSFTPVSATSEGNIYTLRLGDMKMVIDGMRGAVITEFSLDGKNALVTRDENSTYGSIFWPSPQSSWCAAGGACWPPPAAIDGQPYTGAVDAGTNTIELTSGEASVATFAGSAIVARKRFTPVPDSGAVDVTYTLTNTSPSVAVSLAPWQVSRVAAGGLTFFAPGAGPVTYAPDSDPAFSVTEAAGHFWYAFAPVAHNSKALSDAAGWLAHVTPARLLFLVSYPDIDPAAAAPGEAEVAIFAGREYVEIEPQGALAEIAPGASLIWTVRWKLRRVPGGTPVVTGDPLLSLASATLAE